ncbi:MAG: TonB-dependent receptor plug domain-containing protein [Fibrobacteria bacterium]|nr:TonB-dependent receptor plug domain-containing protein [Fibrobacteria bacterium]
MGWLENTISCFILRYIPYTMGSILVAISFLLSLFIVPTSLLAQDTVLDTLVQTPPSSSILPNDTLPTFIDQNTGTIDSIEYPEIDYHPVKETVDSTRDSVAITENLDTIMEGATPTIDSSTPEPPIDSSPIIPSQTTDSVSSPSPPATIVDSSEAASTLLELKEKVVKDKLQRIHRRKKISRQRLDRLQIQKVPAVQGDPIRAINTLPGVTTQSDASVRPYVRGGKAEETRVFWDNMPLMQPYHFGGLYSLFNVESIEDINIYSGAFPVEGNNAMSGAIFLKSRPAPLDSFRLFTDVSLLRGNIYAGLPIIKDRVGVYFSYQAFWYDWFYHRTLDATEFFVEDDSFTEYRKNFEKYVDLPNYRDFQFGTTIKLTRDITANYVGLLSHDIFSNMWLRQAYYVEGEEVAPTHHKRHLFFSNLPSSTRSKRSILDTLAIVRVNNDIHNVNLKWNLNDNWTLENSVALQMQRWHVEFFQGDEWEDNSESWEEFDGQRIKNSDGFKLKLKRDFYNYKANFGYYGFKDHEISGGYTYDYLEETFDTDMLRFIFEIIYNGNTDLLSSLGHYGTDGFAITKNTPGSDPNLNYMNRLLEQIQFRHKGKVWGSYYGLYAEDSWNISKKQRLISGLRLEYEENSGDYFPSPRFSYFLNLNKKNELTFATGMYSQNDILFYIRDTDIKLKSEKSWHLNSEWTHHFSDHYRFELQNYYKFYWDLITPELYNTGELSWNYDDVGNQDSASFEELTESEQQEYIDLHGEREFRYFNTGIGHAFGSEFSFFYDPMPSWNGWISAEWSMSKRQDTDHASWYDFRYHRPWILNWVNYFKFPNSKYEMSIRARYSSGLPYTDFKTNMNTEADTMLYVGKRNAKRYMPYQRVDLRITRNSMFFGHPFQTYFAVWNFFNRPNFLLRDNETEKIKYFNLNIPFPVLFLGMNYRW